MVNTPIITIDGPSGVGKGTIGRIIAQKLNFHFLDSGALYRVCAYACQKHQINPEDIYTVTDIAKNLKIEFKVNHDALSEPAIIFEQEQVNQLIRTESCGALASKISAYPSVRQALINLQHNFVKTPGLIADGRDMGTIIFPKANKKFFLTASSQVRAERRQKQLQAQGFHANIDNLLKEIEDRDHRDQTRAISPLVPAKDAVIIDTSHLSIDEVVNLVLQNIGGSISSDIESKFNEQNP